MASPPAWARAAEWDATANRKAARADAKTRGTKRYRATTSSGAAGRLRMAIIVFPPAADRPSREDSRTLPLRGRLWIDYANWRVLTRSHGPQDRPDRKFNSATETETPT